MTNDSKGRSRRDHSLWDDAVNKLWDGQKPVLSPEETLAAAKKLYRHAMGKAWHGKWALVSGNRYTWVRNMTFYVNPDRSRAWQTPGLRDVIHLMSHWCHRRLHPRDKPHSIRQLRLEARLTKFAVARRWHEGGLKKPAKPEAATPAPAKPDVVVARYRRMVTRRDKYARELDRSTRLLAKATQEVAQYERRHGQRVRP
jgi:hypothetical protein